MSTILVFKRNFVGLFGQCSQQQQIESRRTLTDIFERPKNQFMRKIFFLFFILSLNCFSQKIEKLDFTISEIDSLCKKENCLSIHDLGGEIKAEKIIRRNAEKEIKIIGSGYGGIKPHSYFTDSLNYEKLNLKEKRKYNVGKYCKFIRADYSSVINYEDGTYQKVEFKFYYNQNELFYVKYKESSFENKIEKVKYYNLFVSELEKMSVENQYLREWIIDKNEEIIKKCITE